MTFAPARRSVERMMDGYDMSGSGWIAMIALLVVLILGVALLLRWLEGQGAAPRGPSARELLDERLARGEIDALEYTHLRRTLGDEPRSGQRGPDTDRRSPPDDAAAGSH